MADNFIPVCPYTEHEKWETFERHGKTIARVTGRTPCPKNIQTWAWMLRNDYQQQLPDWYQPQWPLERREFYWNNLRNPLQNARCFTWGWMDRNYEVEVTEGRFDQPFLIQRNDLTPPEDGYQKCKLTPIDGSDAPRTFTSYCSPKLVWYLGTQPSGLYGAKFNIPK